MVELFLYLIEKLISIAMRVQSIAENTDNKIVLKDILKKCFSKKPELSLMTNLKFQVFIKQNQ